MADLRQRAPRQISRDHKGFIAGLPCVACLVTGPKIVRPVQVAHLSIGSLEHGKRATGMAEKASDQWTLPLCWPHHQGHAHKVGRRGGQHEGSEAAFWADLRINPFALCEALQKAFGAGQPGTPVVIHFAAEARKEKFG